MSAGLRVDLWVSDGWRWRMWSGSRIVGGSTESYVKRSAAIRNLETVTGGTFEKISTPDFPTPYGVIHRTAQDADYVLLYQDIAVRLVES